MRMVGPAPTSSLVVSESLVISESEFLKGSSHKRAERVCSPIKGRVTPPEATGRSLVNRCETSHTPPASVTKARILFRFSGPELDPSDSFSAIKRGAARGLAAGSFQFGVQ